MLKIGTVRLDTERMYNLFWYNDDAFASRIDVIENLDDYNARNTESCIASYIKGVDERTFGDMRVIDKILHTKLKCATLHMPESRNVSVEDGKFIMNISKESEDGTIRYNTKMINGKIDSEFYKSGDIVIEIGTVSDQTYDPSSRPVNWEDYAKQMTMAEITSSYDTVKVEQAEYKTYEELLRQYPEVTHVLENDYVIAGSYEEAEERLKYWIESTEQLKSYDIESIGKEWGPSSDNRITGIFLGLGETWSTYFPFRQTRFKYNLPIEYLEKIFDAINDQPPYPTVILLGHNMKFEIEGFYQEFRKRIRIDIDTYILSVLIDPNVKKGTHTLKALAYKADGKFYLTLEQIFIGPVKFNVLTEDIVKLYGCPDATSPAKVYKMLIKQLPKDERFVMMLEMRLVYIKACHNEFYGMRLDQEKLNKLLADEQYKVDMLHDLFCKIYRTSKNINSYGVLSEILYYKLKCPVTVYTSKGLPATSKEAIDSIINTGAIEVTPDTVIPKDIVDSNGNTIIEGKTLAANKYPSLIIFQEYKKCMKTLGALRRLKDHSVNDFFKFYINQCGAGSNRQTSDAHQFSDAMKMCAVADSPHHRLVSCDWSQVELRILAGLAGQKDLMELESDPGVDIHRAICSIITKTPIYLISEEDRKRYKSVNFGVVYKMTEYGLARREYGARYTKAQLAEMRQRIMDFFNNLPFIKQFIHDNEVYLRTNGFIKTLFCYYRYFKELLDPNIDPKLAEKLVRAGNNTPVQGTGAGMMKIVEVKVDEYMLKKGWLEEKNYGGRMLPKARMILPIHDEILASFDKDIPMEEIIMMFRDCMELNIQGMPPFFASPAFVDNWYDGKNSVYEIPHDLREQIIDEYKKGNYMLTGHDYLEVLQNYRNSEIKNYMSDLIAKYKTVDEVAEHVTHDSLTHTLIEAMIPSKKERGKLTHKERIHEATKRYMDSLESKGELNTLLEAAVTANDEDKDLRDEFMETDEWALSYAHIDANGDLVEEEVSEEDREYYEVTSYEDVEGYSDDIEIPRALYLLHECMVDLTGLDIDKEGEQINQAIQALCEPDAYYDLCYIMGNKPPIKTGRKIAYRPDEINGIFNNVLGGIKNG